MASFRLWHLRPPTKLWGRYDPKTENFIITMVLAMSRFVLITRSIFDLTTCAIPLCKALTDDFTLWPKNWKFHHYNGVAMSRFVLITRSIFDLMCLPLCKALTDGFISTITSKTSDKVMGTLWPENWKFHHYNGVAIITRSIFDLTTCAIPLCKALDVMTQKLKISSLQWCCDVSFCPHNSVNFWLNDMCHTSV